MSSCLFLNRFKNSLSNLLGTIKQYYSYYPAAATNLNEHIARIEEVILSIQSLEGDYNEKTANDEDITSTSIGQCEEKIFEMFFFFFSLNTNNTFYDIYIKTFEKFLKKSHDCHCDQYFLENYKIYYSQIYDVLLNKEIEFNGMFLDSKVILNIVKCISKMIRLFAEYKVNYDDLQLDNLLSYFLMMNYNVFTMTKTNAHIEYFMKILNKVFKTIYESNEHRNQIERLFDQLLNKILEIAKIKDEMKHIDDQEQSYQVDTLIVCLKLTSKLLKAKEKSYMTLFSYKTKAKLSKCLIELSFWDNPHVVNYTCKLYTLLWHSAIAFKGIGMRSELEKISEFIFLRHFNQYYNYFTSNQLEEHDTGYIDQKIKLAVLEILIRYFNDLISKEQYLYICYLANDSNKFRINIINEIFTSLQKYFNLSSSTYLFFKKCLIKTFQTAFEQINHMINTTTPSVPSSKILSIQDQLSDKWIDVFKLINEGKFKQMYKVICEQYKMTQLGKRDKLETLPEEQRLKHKEIAKSIAIIIRYSYFLDINKLYEIMGDNHAMSQIILEEYTQTFNFKGLSIIKAYELYVSTFKLTGETSHIGNFVYSFSQKYFKDNKTQTKENDFHFKKADEVNYFAYSIMMLNTDLHNPNVPYHMTCDDYIKNNQSSNLYEDVPKEYMKAIYDRISSMPLKAAQPRSNNYSKEDELYLALESLHSYITTHDEFNEQNLFEQLLTLDNESMLSYPLFNLSENIYLNNTNKELGQILSDCSPYIFEDLFCTVLSLPQSFYELKDEIVFELFNSICSVASSLNKKEVVDKIIKTIHSFLNSTSKTVSAYNLFFKISIKHVSEFHIYLEMYYNTIVDIISFKLKEENNPLRIEYTKFIDEIIYKTYSASDEKKNRNKSSSYFYFLSSSPTSNEDENYYETFKLNKYQQMNIISSSSQPHNISKNNVNELIPLKEVLTVIKAKEEDFIFFATYSTSKILESSNKNEFYISLIFLKEILKGISQKEFIKIWQNLYNIFISKMKFKIDNDNSLFDFFYTNFFFYQILSQYFTSIENDDYYQLLENYINIDDIEILYIILENNNTLLINGIKEKKKINDQIFGILIFLIHRLLEMLSRNNSNMTVRNNTQLAKFVQGIEFFNNVVLAIKDINVLLPDSLNSISNIIKVLYEINISELLAINNFHYDTLEKFIGYLSEKMANVLPLVNDEKWDLYIYLGQFCFKCALVKKDDIQPKFMELLIYIFETPKIPLVRYDQIINILSKWYEPFMYLKIKYEHYWDDVFKIFYILLVNNDEVKTSMNELEKLWTLFRKNYLIAYVDEYKRLKKEIGKESMEDLEKIYVHINDIIKASGEKVVWWESSKNSIKLYFPNFIKE